MGKWTLSISELQVLPKSACLFILNIKCTIPCKPDQDPHAHVLAFDASQTSSFKTFEFTAYSGDMILINSHLLVGA